MITLDNFDSPSFDIYDINLVQKEVDGGTIAKEKRPVLREKMMNGSHAI